jgi:hypothetical protein
MKLEFLGDGQQCIAFGRHPSGIDYRWWPNDPQKDLTNVSRDDLPYIDANGARELIEELADLLARDFGFTLQEKPVRNSPNDDAANKARPQRTNGAGQTTAYGRKPLEDECARVATAKEGTRNDELNRAAFALGQLVAGGEVDEVEARDGLYNAALANGLIDDDGVKAALKTIESGLRDGMGEPRSAPEQEDRRSRSGRRRQSETGSHTRARGPDGQDGEADEKAVQPRDDETVVIYCTGGALHKNATDAEAALIAAGTQFYTRGHCIVMPIVEEVDAARAGKTKVARVKDVAQDCMTDYLSRVATFMKFDRRIEQFVKCNPPPHVAKTVLSRDGEWNFKRIAGVITTQTMRRDGTILGEPGYDPETKLLLMDPPSIPTVPDRPSPDEAENALALLHNLLAGFPFTDDESRTVALSGLITPVVRGAMTVAPLHAITAPSAGTGKSYLVELCYAIATGQVPPALAAGRTEEETEKRLASAVIAARSIIAIDNLNGELGGDLLCQLVERPMVSVRPLGVSKLIDVESRATVFANGNNIIPRGDIVRRTLLCTLDANMERPEQRHFKTNPLSQIMADRGKYIAAALTIVRAFLTAGRPSMPPPLASYDEWTTMVRAPLMWLGCEDPVKTQEKARDSDPELIIFSAVMAQLVNLIGPGHEKMTAGQIKDAAEEKYSGSYGNGAPTYRRPELRKVLLDAAGRHDEIESRKLGNFLTRFKGRIAGGMKLVALPNRDHQNEYKIIEA